MQRGPTGDYLTVSTVGDEVVRAFVPRPLPPVPPLDVDPALRDRDTVDTVLPKLAERGVQVVPFGPKRLRAVTHLDVSAAEVDRAAAVIAEVLGA